MISKENLEIVTLGVRTLIIDIEHDICLSVCAK